MKNVFKKLFGKKETTGNSNNQVIKPDVENGIAKLFYIVVDGKPIDGIGSHSLMEARANRIRAKLYVQGDIHYVNVVAL